MKSSKKLWQCMQKAQKASKTMKSYELLINGDVDSILVPDPSKEVEEMAKTAGTELEYIPVGAEALVFITHEENPVDDNQKMFFLF